MSNPMRRATKNGTRNVQPAKTPPPSPLKRLDDLESSMQMLLNISNQLHRSINALTPIVEAMEELWGTATVESKQDEIMVRKGTAAIETALAEGSIAPTDVVDEKSVVVGVQTGPDGKIMRPGRLQVRASDFRPEVREDVVGKGVGHVYMDPNGASFEVLQIFRQVEAPASVPTPLAVEEVPVDAPAEEAPAPAVES